MNELRAELDSLRAEYKEYAYVVSHDLSAPLRHIDGFAKILHKKNTQLLDDESKRYLEFIIDSAETGKNILDGLLDYARLDTQVNPFTKVDCIELLEQVLDTKELRMKASQADVTYPDQATVTGDIGQLYQVFYHLIHNALHYQQPESKAIVSVGLTEKAAVWEFSVVDNGVGIPIKLHESIFTLLKRGVNKKEYSGIGIGLTLVKKIVRRHGGEIWATANEECGSTFRFTLAKNLQCE